MSAAVQPVRAWPARTRKRCPPWLASTCTSFPAPIHQKGPTVTDIDPTAGFREGRLAAIALARSVLFGDALGIDTLLDADDLKATAAGLVEMVASLLLLLPHDQVLPVLDELTARAFGPDGDRP